MNRRLENLRQKLPENGLDAILIFQAENRRYLSGFTGTTAFLFISQQDAVLATDSRYVEQAERQAPDFHIRQIKGDFAEWFSTFISEFGVHKLGFESYGLCFAGYQELEKALDKVSSDARPQLIPMGRLVDSLRAIKEKGELELIERAVALTDAALGQIVPMIRPGMTERQIAWEVERFLKENGCESLPFDLIVASGPNSALPHAQPTGRPVCCGEPVVIDIGARVGGYCSDITRTIHIGEAHPTLSQIYDIVLEAQKTAIEGIEVGMSGGQADHLARAVIEQAGYGDAFGHSLGHGVGLAAHEEPHLGANSPSLLSEGMVFTIEPGIYLRGWGGVRIEDMVVLEGRETRLLTKAEK